MRKPSEIGSDIHRPTLMLVGDFLGEGELIGFPADLDRESPGIIQGHLVRQKRATSLALRRMACHGSWLPDREIRPAPWLWIGRGRREAGWVSLGILFYG